MRAVSKKEGDVWSYCGTPVSDSGDYTYRTQKSISDPCAIFTARSVLKDKGSPILETSVGFRS